MLRRSKIFYLKLNILNSVMAVLPSFFYANGSGFYCLYCFYFSYLDIVLSDPHNRCPTASRFTCQLCFSKSTIRRNCKGDGPRGIKHETSKKAECKSNDDWLFNFKYDCSKCGINFNGNPKIICYSFE